jgi:hypothetical protein
VIKAIMKTPNTSSLFSIAAKAPEILNAIIPAISISWSSSNGNDEVYLKK